MPSLAEASLSDVERRVLARIVRSLEAELGNRLRAVWLYGSRARGETPHPESDVDLIVVAEGAGDERRISDLVYDAAVAQGANPWLFSAHVYTPQRLTQRREIRSFFMQDVDRDKIVVAGEP